MKSWMMKVGGLFNRLAMESAEMAYQYEYEYLFESTKFEKRFFKATTSAEALKLTAKTYNR